MTSAMSCPAISRHRLVVASRRSLQACASSSASRSSFMSKDIVQVGPLFRGRTRGAAYFYFFSGPSHEKPVQVAAKPAIFVDLPEVLVNLSNAASERTQYLKVKIVLELPNPE